MMFDYSSYEAWFSQQASIEAPKIAISMLSDGQRGLVATQTIHPDERIMFIPAHSLLSSSMLHCVGQLALNKPRTVPPRTLSDWEAFAIGCIEEIRSVISVKLEHEWRDDDSVALYLAICRHILENFDAPDNLSHEDRDQNNISIAVSASNVQSSDYDNLPLIAAIPVEFDEALPTSTQQDEEPVGESEPAKDLIGALSFLPHVAALPNAFPNNPLYFTAEELSRLDGTNCHGYTIRMKAQIESDWSAIRQLLLAFHECEDRKMICPCKRSVSWTGPCRCSDFVLHDIVTHEAYKWSICNIYSRSTDFAQGEGHHRVIAPLFDMMNHSFSSDVTHAMDSCGNLSVFNGPTKSIEPGEEIFLSYGSFPNEKLLLIYGFVVPDNVFDCVSIYAPIPPGDPLYHVKARLLATKCNISSPHSPHQILACHRQQGQSVIPASLTSALRVTGIQSLEEIMAIASAETTEDEGIGMIGINNEIAALSALHQALHQMARTVALSMISDENLGAASSSIGSPPPVNGASLENGSLARELSESEANFKATNYRNAKILCQSEYLTLQAAINELTERLQTLRTSTSEEQI